MAYTIQDALLAECLLTSSWSADWKFPWNTVFGLLHKLERFAIVSHLLLPERCCLQIQSVYCVNYAKNILSGNELFSTFPLRLPLCATSLVLVFLSLLGSNQYFIYFSMLKNLWAMLHICKIYSYSCVHYRLLWIFPHMKVAHVAFLPHRAPPDSFLVCVHLFALLFRFAYILIFSSRINLLFCFICRKKRKRANIEWGNKWW